MTKKLFPNGTSNYNRITKALEALITFGYLIEKIEVSSDFYPIIEEKLDSDGLFFGANVSKINPDYSCVYFYPENSTMAFFIELK